MPTLEDIRQEFPTANHAPDPGCERCGGTGSTGPRKIVVIGQKPDGKTGAWIEERPDERQPCMCIYISGQAIREIVQECFNEMAAEARRK